MSCVTPEIMGIAKISHFTTSLISYLLKICVTDSEAVFSTEQPQNLDIVGLLLRRSQLYNCFLSEVVARADGNADNHVIDNVARC
jgi:hypothetical protein